MDNKIHYPAVCFDENKMWVETPDYPFTAKAIRQLQGRTYTLCDSRGEVYEVGSPIPEHPLTLADRLFNRWMRATYGVVKHVGHWTIDEFKARVCEALDKNKDFWEAVQSVVLWKMEVNAAKSYLDIMELLHPREEQA